MSKKLLPIALACFCLNAFAVELPTSKEALLERFLQAHENKNYDEISQLINWDEVRRYKQKMIRVYTRNNFGRKVINTEFEEADTAFLNSFSVGNRDYHSNMPVTHLMRIYFEDTVGDEQPEYGSVVYLVGQQDSHYRIAIAVKDQTKEQTGTH